MFLYPGLLSLVVVVLDGLWSCLAGKALPLERLLCCVSVFTVLQHLRCPI
jgi:hypothetical protein